jgi:uncharacterized membrane protein (DUF485 family)
MSIYENEHAPPSPSESRYIAVQQSEEFRDLRRRYRGWVLPVAAVSLLWYFVYVLLAAYAKDFMSIKLVGDINVGLVMGLLQFLTTFGVTALYIRFADKVLDPARTRIRDQIEEEVRRP